jgi:hypothetical protein
MPGQVNDSLQPLQLVDPRVDETCIEYANGGLLKDYITQQPRRDYPPEEQGRLVFLKR